MKSNQYINTGNSSNNISANTNDKIAFSMTGKNISDDSLKHSKLPLMVEKLETAIGSNVEIISGTVGDITCVNHATLRIISGSFNKITCGSHAALTIALNDVDFNIIVLEEDSTFFVELPDSDIFG